MPPKKSASAAKPAASKTQGPTYEDMIKDAILNLKDRKGSSRPNLKKYVQANNKTAEGPTFDKLFNNALSKGVTKGIFVQPKGASGTVKLAAKVKPTDEKNPAAEKPAAKPATKAAAKPAAKKTAAAKKTVGAPKKAAAAKTTKAKVGAPKKAAATKKTPAAKAVPAKKAAAKKPGPKKAAPAPAVEDKPVVLGKTKGGRITKTTSKSAPPVTKKVTKVPAKSKKATPKKATPKKA